MPNAGTSGSSGSTRILRPSIGARLTLVLRLYTSRVLRVVSSDSRNLGRRTYSLFPLAYIESVKSVLDPNPLPTGLHQYSVVVSTAQREMKFTAPTKERHDIWFNVREWNHNTWPLVLIVVLGSQLPSRSTQCRGSIRKPCSARRHLL